MKMMREAHRLRALKVCVARHHDVDLALRAHCEHRDERIAFRDHTLECGTRPKAHVGGDLIVA